MSKNLALFDFDGTLTTKDTLFDFIRYAVGSKRYYRGLLKKLPMLIAFKLKFIPNDEAKMRMLSHYFKGYDAQKFRELGRSYALTQIDTILRKEAKDRLDYHKQQGDRIIVVSASLTCWLEPWCQKEEIELLSTQMEIDQGKLTGRFATPNCHDQEKVNRIRAHLDPSDYAEIYAYGDSSGDTQMLEMATHAYYRRFPENG